MSVVHGKNGVVSIGAPPGNAVLRLKSYEVDEKVDTADFTVMGAAAKTHEVGIPEWSAKLTALRDKTDTTGSGALTIGASVVANFYDYGTASGQPGKSGTGTVTSISTPVAIGDVISQSFEITGNGVLGNITA